MKIKRKDIRPGMVFFNIGQQDLTAPEGPGELIATWFVVTVKNVIRQAGPMFCVTYLVVTHPREGVKQRVDIENYEGLPDDPVWNDSQWANLTRLGKLP